MAVTLLRSLMALWSGTKAVLGNRSTLQPDQHPETMMLNVWRAAESLARNSLLNI
jgi:hypothetical protein